MQIEHITLQPVAASPLSMHIEFSVDGPVVGTIRTAKQLVDLLRASGLDCRLSVESDLYPEFAKQLMTAATGLPSKRNEFGFSVVAPLIGEPRQPSPAHHTNTEACPETPAATPDQDTVAPATDVSAAPDSACLQFPLPQQGEAMRAPVHLSEPQGDRVSRSFRFLRW